MSAVVKLSSKMPGDAEVNGVDAIALDLCDNPADIRCAIVLFDVQKVILDTDAGTHVPTIRVRKIEPIGLVTEVPAVVQHMVEEAMEKRTGRTALPFETTESDPKLDDD